jgi:hypothetical protein
MAQVGKRRVPIYVWTRLPLSSTIQSIFMGQFMGEKMARKIERLSALAVSRAKAPGYYPDGGGLYLHITATGAKSWVYRFMLNGKAREMGLGPLHVVNLSEARGKAADCRRLRLEGIDPIEARKSQRDRTKLEAANSITFKECAAAYIKAHKAGWRNGKHADQWANTLATYAEPVFDDLPVQSINTGLVMLVLEPIWAEKAETASRVRQRIEAILNWAKTRGYRSGENPAAWKGHLENLLPRISKVARVEHHRCPTLYGGRGLPGHPTGSARHRSQRA